MQAHKILIGTVLITLIVTGFMLFLAGGVQDYELTDYNDTSLTRITSTFENIKNITDNTKDKLDVQTDQASPSPFDLILTQGTEAAKLVGGSFESIYVITDTGLSEVSNAGGLGGFGNTLKIVIAAIILIILVIGLLLHFIIKSDRL